MEIRDDGHCDLEFTTSRTSGGPDVSELPKCCFGREVRELPLVTEKVTPSIEYDAMLWVSGNCTLEPHTGIMKTVSVDTYLRSCLTIVIFCRQRRVPYRG